MNLKDFWKERERKHLTKIGKYLKYVFNDHFILFAFILFGAIAYLYSEYVKSIQINEPLPLYVLGVFIGLMPFVGNFSTLLQEADKLFLLPIEDDFNPIASRLRRRSFLIPLILLGFTAAMASPMLVAYQVYSFSNWWQLWVLLILLKWINLYAQQILYKSWHQDWTLLYHAALGIVNIILVYLFIFTSIITSISLALVLLISTLFVYQRFFESERWNWEYMITKEESRLTNQLKLINLFTDIPEIKSEAKRNKIFDPLIQSLPKANTSAALHLVSRGFFRNPSYINLYIRLLAIALILILLVPTPWMSLIIGLLFLFMIGFQLIPLANQYEKVKAQAVIPVAQDLIIRETQRLINWLLQAASLFFGIMGLFNTTDYIAAIVNMLIYILFSFLFTSFYIPRRLKKKQK
ncbi:MAG: ABC transporter permease [Atopococcus tabaci]|uniref:ABC transporter permease n=1 Tax=Atopococcus tabaci TaxID=269774 RepID=A0AA43ZSS7_9LACT|nr:ABC transporter permease [Atopococcus tabaci]